VSSRRTPCAVRRSALCLSSRFGRSHRA
jgi:hypothetical protein